MKTNTKFWTWNSRKLANPLTILRRLIMYPFMFIARVLLFITVLAGWGMDAAIDNWNMTD